MASNMPADKKELCDIGLCRSWKEQQKNISAFLHVRSLRSETIPRLLLAQFDNESITVYQAYKPAIGMQAARRGNFVDSEFSFSRMTWVKPNFTWMMYRAGWGSKLNQETILAIKLRRSYFDEMLAKGVPTSWDDASYGSTREWSKALRESDVLVQWDPDHHLLSGAQLPYRVLQLGIRGGALDGFKGPGIISITDITSRVHQLHNQLLRKALADPASCDGVTPLERRYPVSEAVQKRHMLS